MPRHDTTKSGQAEKQMPHSLRIQPEIMALATAIAKEQGEGQMAPVLRQALSCGLLVMATSLPPDAEGKLATFDPTSLAKALRRRLAAAVDLLIEHGQLPQGIALVALSTSLPPHSSAQRSGPREPALPLESSFAFDSQMSDDLDALGIGVGISATLQ